MIVRNAEGSEKPLLAASKDYVVLSVEINGGVPYIRILSEDLTPRLYDLRDFEIRCGNFDTNWEVIISGDRLCLGPSAWYMPGFWEAYFNGEPREVEIFSRIAESILSTN